MSATRVCTKCFQEKPIEEFGWKDRPQGKRHAVCKPCTAVRSNAWYHRNKETHIQNVMFHKEAARQEAREYVWDYLSKHPCIDCGEADPVVLEFDHVNGKDATVASLIRDGVSTERIRQEIGLCVVRCANCHRRKTMEERGWFRGTK